jgi:NAD+ synthase (glutamine-hydrolysing)
MRIGVTICEDIWTEDYLQRPFYDRDPVNELAAKGIDLLLNLSASPFHLGKPTLRRAMIGGIARRGSRHPVVYCNAVGANDQLVFDGHSLVAGPNGRIQVQVPGFIETCRVVDPFVPVENDAADC